MPNAQPFISLNDVSIRLHDRILFENLCWQILDDQHWAVLGPNGSGKSALMKALCGTLPVARGEVVYHFLRDNGHSSVQEHIAYVNFESQRKVLGDEAFYQERWNVGVNQNAFSVSEFLSERTVRQMNPYVVVENYSTQDYAVRRRRVVEQLELGRLLERNIEQLSNGERRKVTLAQALLKNPKLLILDSPFAGLDERFRVQLAENLETLMQGEMRVLLAGTHRDEIPHGMTHVLELPQGHVHAVQMFRVERPLRTPSGKKDLSSAPTRPVSANPPPRNDAGGMAKPTNLVASPQYQVSNPTAPKVLVHLDNVSVSYNGTPVLRQVNWTIRENERWALFGPNGAGKTTLLSLILADNPQAYANDVTLFGKRRGTGESIWEIKQDIGWVAPELQLYYPPSATCLDVVCSGWFDSVGLFRQCSPKQREIAVSWLRRLNLAAPSDAIFDQVSEGEQRLVLLARALVKRPALLVLDEPCQGLDTDNRDRVLQAIDGIGSQPNSSMIYVTHRADELPHSITHVLRLNEGQVVDQFQMENDKRNNTAEDPSWRNMEYP